MSRQTALVTGSRGFLGSAAARELEGRGWRVIGSYRADCDLADPEAVRDLLERTRPALILHVAGAIQAPDVDRFWDIHVAPTINLLESAAAAPRPPRVVIAGSSAEYGSAAGRKPVTEEYPISPISPYGLSKVAQRLAAQSYGHRGLPIVIARIFNSSGPGCPEKQVPGAFAKQIALIEAGRQPPRIDVGNLSPRRDFLDVRDIARALADLSANSVAPGIYNVCSGRATAISDVLKALIELSNTEISLHVDPGRRRKAELSFIVGDNSKLRRATGWRPQIPLGQSLSDVLDWHRQLLESGRAP